MPANIAHMLIAHKALALLKRQAVQEFADFAKLLDDTSRGKNFRTYMNLGSLGPDLYYYAKITSSIKDMLKEGFVQAKGVTPWAYHLHTNRPNMFALRLSEILFSDAVKEKGKVKLYDDDIRKLAYIAGHLTHIAADQIIHPVVNRIAKPYYRSGKNRKKHRECEVFQDYFLYEEVYRAEREKLEGKKRDTYDFFKQPFNKWIDCVRGFTTRNTEDWFRYFLQRGFVETYGTFPPEDEIENSVDNLLLTLKTCQAVGPYKKAAKDYDKNKAKSKMYKQYIKDVKYVKFFEEAVKLSVIYIIALYEVYAVLKQGKDFTDQHKRRFGNIVSDADLSCPLKQKIFEKAYKALTSKKQMQNKCKDLFN